MDNKDKVIFGLDLVYMKTEEVEGKIQNFITKHGLKEGLLVLKYDLLPLMKDEKHWNADKGRCLLVEDIIRKLEDRKETPTGTKEFQVKSIALALFCSMKTLSEPQAVDIAARYGYGSKFSGRNLKNAFNDLRDGAFYSKNPKRMESYFSEAAKILKSNKTALEALQKLKSEYLDRQGL